jgi:hypothetical protein
MICSISFLTYRGCAAFIISQNLTAVNVFAQIHSARSNKKEGFFVYSAKEYRSNPYTFHKLVFFGKKGCILLKLWYNLRDGTGMSRAVTTDDTHDRDRGSPKGVILIYVTAGKAI